MLMVHFAFYKLSQENKFVMFVYKILLKASSKRRHEGPASIASITVMQVSSKLERF